MMIYREAVFNEWREWFAWHPVRTVNYEWVWLEVVERKMYEAKVLGVEPHSWIVYRKKAKKRA